MSFFGDFLNSIGVDWFVDNNPINSIEMTDSTSVFEASPFDVVEDSHLNKECNKFNLLVASLMGFRNHLIFGYTDSTDALSKYSSLDPELKTVIGKSVWIACFHPEGDPDFAENLLKKNPRFLLECKNAAGQDLLTQIIQHYESKSFLSKTFDELNHFISKFERCGSKEGQLKLFKSLPDYLRHQLTHIVWYEHGGKTDEKFGYWGYGEDQINRDPTVLTPALLERYQEKLKIKASYSLLDDGLEKYSRMRIVPSSPVPTSISSLSQSLSLSKKRVVMFSPEISGVVTAGGLGPAVAGMARGYGIEWVRVVLPKYDIINPKIEMKEKPKYLIELDGKVCKVFKAKINGLRCYFIDDPEHFTVGFNENGKPNKVYDAKSDLAEKRRWLHFQSSSAELGYKFSQKPENPIEVIHVHDAQTALIPKLMINRHYFEWKEGKTPATVFSVHNNLCPMRFDYPEAQQVLTEIGMQDSPLISFIEGVETSEMIVPVSKQFASEFQTERFGNGMERFTKIAAMEGKVVGVTNGNVDGWNPEKDMQLKNWRTLGNDLIDLSYGASDPLLSIKLKRIRHELAAYLQHHFKAEFDPKKPIFFYVGRYDSYQKGIDKLPLIMNEVLENGGQFICIGSDPDINADLFLKEMEKKADELGHNGVLIIRDYKRLDDRFYWQQGNVSIDDTSGVQGFGNLLRAAVDIGVFPSIFEPCGLVQGEMHRMGKMTLTTDVGGFINTVFTSGPHTNGYRFERHEWNSKEQSDAISKSIRQAVQDSSGMLRSLYQNDEKEVEPYLNQMRTIMRNALNSTWTSTFDGSLSPSESYNVIYNKAVSNLSKRGTVFVDVFPLQV